MTDRIEHSVAFVLNAHRYQTRVLLTPEGATGLRQALEAEATALKGEHGEPAVTHVDVSETPPVDPITVGSAEAMVEFLFESVGQNRRRPSAMDLMKAARSLDDDRKALVNDPNRPNLSAQVIGIEFLWRFDENVFADSFLATAPQIEQVRSFVGQLADWLVKEKLGHDIGFFILSERLPPLDTVANALGQLSETVLEDTLDPTGEDAAMQMWGEALQRLADAQHSPQIARRRRSTPR